MTLTVPFTFVDGTVAEAPQVNANFAAVVNSINANTRTVLGTNITFYVSPTGTDSGPATNPAAPAQTIGYVIGLIRSTYDLGNTSSATISLANGSYNENVNINGALPGQVTATQLIIQGNVGTPGSVAFVGAPAFTLVNGAMAQIQGLAPSSLTTDAIAVGHQATLNFQALAFGAATNAQLRVVRGGSAFSVGNYTITAGANWHIVAEDSTTHITQATPPYIAPGPGIPVVTITGTPAFGTAFIQGVRGAIIRVLATFSGSATGVRYLVNSNAVIDTNGAGATYLPGNAGGSTATGGQYV